MSNAKPTRTHKESKWLLDPHIEAKHAILRRYLAGWFPVMARFNKRLVFIDGFAGPGSYVDGEPGSPVIALKTLIEHAAFENMSSTEFVFVFLEAEEDRHQHLAKSLEEYASSIGGWPPNVRVTHRCVSFADGAEEILSSLEASGAKLAPALVFIDPFGVSGLSLIHI